MTYDDANTLLLPVKKKERKGVRDGRQVGSFLASFFFSFIGRQGILYQFEV